jgi:cysteine desulfuration protein SufE
MWPAAFAALLWRRPRVYIERMDQSQQTMAGPPGRIDAILADFELLDDWEDRYRYVIELGRTLEPLPDEARNARNKVQGCVSQVWLETTPHRDGRNTRLTFIGDSDAHIVRGLIAILLALYSGVSAEDILKIDANAVLNQLHLKEHLTPQRSNGLLSMVERIRTDARGALASAATH